MNGFDLDWFKQNSNKFFYGAMIALFALIYIYRIGVNNKIHTESDYFSAEKEFQILMNDDTSITAESKKDALDRLEKILKKQPALASKYEAPLVETLLIEDQSNEASELSKDVFKRTQANQPIDFYEFSTNTLEITKGQYFEALGRAKELNKTLSEKIHSKEAAGYEKLYSYNLLRLALLEQLHGNKENAHAFWQDLKNYLYSESKGNEETQLFFDTLFAEGEFSLKSYIEIQENKLKETRQ